MFKFLTAPLEVLSDENFNVTGLKCQQMELGEPDASAAAVRSRLKAASLCST